MEYLASMLRTIAEQADVSPVGKVVFQPGVKSVYRLTVRYHDRRAYDSVATLIHKGPGDAVLEVVYRGLFGHRPLKLAINQDRFHAFFMSLHKAHFDRLGDQQNIPPYGVDLWLLERAASSFYKSVIIAPELTAHVYARLVYEINLHLPEALKPIKVLDI
jgi:hypothetical protein